MPRCVAFDYFGVDCEKQSVSQVTPPGAVTKHWAPEKAGALHFKRVPGPQKVYFNHCICPYFHIFWWNEMQYFLSLYYSCVTYRYFPLQYLEKHRQRHWIAYTVPIPQLNQPMLQFTNIIHPVLSAAALFSRSCSHRIQIWAIRWPHILQGEFWGLECKDAAEWQQW